ncbi:MAG: hypothetical protein ACI9D5_000675 [Candidatus Endobugula sp.]|jgi:hypothetical protein
MLKKIAVVLIFLSSLALAQGLEQILGGDAGGSAVPSDAYDCTVVQLEAVDETMLTKAERIARMDTSLLDSIDKHDNCIDQVVNNNATSGSEAGAGSGSGGDGGGSEDSEAGNEKGSEASNESAESSPEGKDNTQAENAPEQANSEVETNEQQEQTEKNTELEGNGAKSQDIAPQDNDSAVCLLLKDELNIEKDPKKQSELKEIYNNYHCRG